MLKKSTLTAMFVILFGLSTISPVLAGSLRILKKEPVDEYGIQYIRAEYDAKGGVCPVHMLRIDLNSANVKFDIVIPDGKLYTAKPTSALVKEYGGIAGINGSFFNPQDKAPIGLLMINGRAISAPFALKPRTTFGVTDDGSVLFGRPKFRRRLRPEGGYFSILDEINKKCGNGDIVMYTPEYKKTIAVPPEGKAFVLNSRGEVKKIVVGPATIDTPKKGGVLCVGAGRLEKWADVKEGSRIQLTQTLMYPWDRVVDAFGTLMQLVNEGKYAFDPEEESVGDYLIVANPRSGIGVTREQVFYMVAVDGRQADFKGLTLPEFANLFLELGCEYALNCDGGGSTTLVYRDRVLNQPSDKGGERPVTNAIVVSPRRNF